MFEMLIVYRWQIICISRVLLLLLGRRKFSLWVRVFLCGRLAAAAAAAVECFRWADPFFFVFFYKDDIFVCMLQCWWIKSLFTYTFSSIQISNYNLLAVLLILDWWVRRRYVDLFVYCINIVCEIKKKCMYIFWCRCFVCGVVCVCWCSLFCLSIVVWWIDNWHCRRCAEVIDAVS